MNHRAPRGHAMEENVACAPRRSKLLDFRKQEVTEKTANRRQKMEIKNQTLRLAKHAPFQRPFWRLRETLDPLLLIFPSSRPSLGAKGRVGCAVIRDLRFLPLPVCLLHEHSYLLHNLIFISLSLFLFPPLRCYVNIFPFQYSPFRNLEHSTFKSHL